MTCLRGSVLINQSINRHFLTLYHAPVSGLGLALVELSLYRGDTDSNKYNIEYSR